MQTAADLADHVVGIHDPLRLVEDDAVPVDVLQELVPARGTSLLGSKGLPCGLLGGPGFGRQDIVRRQDYIVLERCFIHRDALFVLLGAIVVDL